MTNLIINKTELQNRINNIKLIAFDVDGVMTNGDLTYDENGVEYKTYNAKDGQGVAMLSRAGFYTAIITARDNGTVKHRFKTLGISKLFEGQRNKKLALDALCSEFNLNYNEIAYMGDDIPDMCVLELVGLACCPNDAVNEIKNISHYICNKNGGCGAVRELSDLLLYGQKKHSLLFPSNNSSTMKD